MGVAPGEGSSPISVEGPENLSPAGMSYRERSMSRPLLFLLFGFLFVIFAEPARAEKSSPAKARDPVFQRCLTDRPGRTGYSAFAEHDGCAVSSTPAWLRDCRV